MLKVSAQRRSRAPYLVLIFDLCLALLLVWLTFSGSAWFALRRDATLISSLVVVNGILAILIAQASTLERFLSIASKYGIEISEKEKKLFEQESPRMAKLSSIVFMIASLTFVLCVYLIESLVPWLFMNDLVRLLTISFCFFLVTFTFIAVFGYCYGRAHPELRSLSEKVRQRARQVERARRMGS